MIEPRAVASEGNQDDVRRRLTVLGIALLVLVAMGWYAITDGQHLDHDPVLAGGDYVGAAICHRITERTFTINGRQLPLCARCTGIYLGEAFSFVALMLAGRTRRTDLPSLPILLLLIGFIGVMGFDGLNSYSHFFPNFPHLYEPRNWLRLLTGSGAGLAMGLLIFPALMQTLWRQANGRSVIESGRELLGIMMLVGTAVLLVLSNQPLILYVMALVSVVGVLLIVTSLNAVFLLMLLKRDGQAIRWQETAVPLLISFGLTILELGIIVWLRLSLTGTLTGFPGLA
ncbi:DUF2085 domain-containing protein [Candidatus Leptofilum sp.]|uniref:DUF2085 domain-containing protein n=1 Tax=Candidatus Leptofilum sp. TaxID=3241576 RepID=UPI003B5C4680